MFKQNAMVKMVDALLMRLFSLDRNRNQTVEFALISENFNLTGKNSFYFMGHPYGDHPRKSVFKTALDPSLVPRMLIHHKEKQQIALDMRLAKMGLMMAVKDCKDYQDLRDALPNVLVEMVDELKVLSRTRPEGYTLQDNPQKMKQYQRFSEIIAIYAMSGMLY